MSTTTIDPFANVRTHNRPCKVGDCDLTAVGRGWCAIHYQRWYRSGSDPSAWQPVARHTDDLVCVCIDPDPDGIGECQNRGCRRPWFSAAYVEELRAVLASGSIDR